MAGSISRRHFLGATGAAMAGGSLVSTVTAGGGGGGPPPATAPRIRKEVNTLSATEIADYRNAVKILKERSAANPADPKGWRAQALIHQNFCPHGNWFFLPWHRAYLYYFEEICREALGAGSTFTLPYWDWTKNPLLPAAFWGTSNPLNDMTREIDPNEGIPTEFVGQNVIDNILGISDFTSFASGKALTQRPNTPPFGSSGELESIPHDNVHIQISGNMGTFMSPLDPIFWLHHGNIDRLWALWSKEHPNSTTNDAAFLNFEVNEFTDLAGNKVKKKVSSILKTTDLGYVYDKVDDVIPVVGAGVPVPVVGQGMMAMAQPTAFALVGTPLSEKLTLNQNLTDRITTAAKAEKRDKTIQLVLRDVNVPENQKVVVRVFLNCPNPNPRTPIGDPTYVGSFTYFGADHQHDEAPAGGHGHGMAAPIKPKKTFTFDISDVVRRLEKAGVYKADTEAKVSLVPVPVRRGQALNVEIKPEKIEILGLN